MAATDIPAQCAKMLRFSKDSELRIFHVDHRQGCGHLSVSGYHRKQKTSFIDLFKIHSDCQGGPVLESSKPFYSKECKPVDSDFCWMTCFLSDSRIVICSFDKLQAFDIDGEGDSLVGEIELDGKPGCMTVSDEMIYVALLSSQVVVFDQHLRKQKTVKLIIGLNFADYPCDIVVHKERLFICSHMWKSTMFSTDGVVLENFRPPNKLYRMPISITVGDKTDVVYILWGPSNFWGVLSSDDIERVVVKYSSSDGRVLAAFSVAIDSWKIDINDMDNRLFVLTRRTGEIYAYDVGDTCNFDNTLTSVELLMEKEECNKLLRRFKVPKATSNTIRGSDVPSRSLLKYLTEKNEISEDDVTKFLIACSHEVVIKASEVLINYQHFQYHQFKRQQQHEPVHESTDDVREEFVKEEQQQESPTNDTD